MKDDINPYVAPRHVSASVAIRRFLGRSLVTGLLAASTLSTGVLLFWLGSIGAVDLGRFGTVALASLLVATVALLAAGRFYSIGWRKEAIALLVIAGLAFVPIVLIAFHEAGILTLF